MKRQPWTFSQAILWGAAAALFLFSLSGCSLLSEAPSGIGGGVALRSDVPLEFTARTDTPAGANLIYRALGAVLIPVPDELRKTAEANCQLTAAGPYGLLPNQGRSTGYIAADPDDPRDEPVYACVMDKTFQRAAMEQVGQSMRPPRQVLHYDRTLRLVRFGPHRVD